MPKRATPTNGLKNTALKGFRKSGARREYLNQLNGELIKRIGQHKFDMWFADTRLSVLNDRLAVSAKTKFAVKWIQSHYTNELQQAAHKILGQPLGVDVIIDDGKKQPSQETRQSTSENDSRGDKLNGGRTPLRKHASHAKGRREHPVGNGKKLNGQPTPAFRRFEQFVVGESNQLAYSTACRLVDDPNASCISPLFIHGVCGVGKTHLLQSICQRWIERHGSPHRMRYVTGEQFTNEYITAVRHNKIDRFRQQVRKLDLLAIDDVHFLAQTSRTQTEFLYTIDAIDLSGARIVLASDNHPHQIKKLNHALVSRFLSGMVVKVNPPDQTMRGELIQRLTKSRGVTLNSAASDAIASKCLGSVRELEGIITTLSAYSDLMHGSHNGSHNGRSNGEIGMTCVDQVLNEHSWRPVQVVRLASIIDAVCSRVGVSRADVMGTGRHSQIVTARALIAYLARELTTHSFPEIAHALSRRNHSTVHTAYHRIARQLNDVGSATKNGSGSPANLPTLVEELKREITRPISK